jgi:hypothetical protein
LSSELSPPPPNKNKKPQQKERVIQNLAEKLILRDIGKWLLQKKGTIEKMTVNEKEGLCFISRINRDNRD